MLRQVLFVVMSQIEEFVYLLQSLVLLSSTTSSKAQETSLQLH